MVIGQVPPEERQQLTTLLAAQQPFRCCPVYLDEEIAALGRAEVGLEVDEA